MFLTEIFEYFANTAKYIIDEIFVIEPINDSDDRKYEIYNLTNGDNLYPDDWKDGIKILRNQQPEDDHFNLHHSILRGELPNPIAVISDSII